MRLTRKMETDDKKHSSAHLASVFADILNNNNEEKFSPQRPKTKGDSRTVDAKIEKKPKKRKVELSKKESTVKTARTKRAWVNLCRRKSDVVQDRETERALIRVATTGVVQLFNAIREHQTDVETAVSQTGATSSKVEKKVKSLTKKSQFLDLVSKTGRKKAKQESGSHSDLKSKLIKKEEVTVEEEDEDEATKWDVLRDDFLSNPAKEQDN